MLLIQRFAWFFYWILVFLIIGVRAKTAKIEKD